MSLLKIPVNSRDHVQGGADAAVTLVEYGDYQCPYCGQAHPIVKQLQSLLGPQLRFVFRNFPLTHVHPQAQAAAMVAEYAGLNGKYWEAHDALFENQSRLGARFYEQLIAALGLSIRDYQTALVAGNCAELIRADFTGGVRSGVNGTPSFFINGRRYDGPLQFEAMADALNRALASSGKLTSRTES